MLLDSSLGVEFSMGQAVRPANRERLGDGMLPYILIGVAVVFEVFADTMMKISDGFKKKWPIVFVAIGYIVAFWSISQVLLVLPLGPVYAAWVGLGIALTAVVGAVLWDEGFNVKKVVGLVAIIAGVVLLRMGV